MKGLVLTYLLAYGGAAVALFNPFVGVCIYWMFDIVRPQYMFAWAGTEGSFSLVIACATIAGWVLKGCGTWRFGRSRLVVGLFAAYAIWVVISAIAAPDQGVALAFLVNHFKRVIMFAIAVTTTDSLARLRQLGWVLTGSAGYLALELNLRYLGGVNEANVFGYGGMDNNSLAISLVTCLGVAVFLGLYEKAWWQKAAAYAAAALISHTVLLTFSRGGMLGMIVAAVVAAVLIPKRPRYLLPIAGAIVLALSLAGPEVRARFMSAFDEEGDRDFSAQSRVELWLDCVEVMRKYPLLGAGPDHFPIVAEEFGWPKGKEAHSLWFQLGAEIGVPGVLFLLFFYVMAIWRLLPSVLRPDVGDVERWGRHAALMVVTSLVGFIISVQFVTMEGLETPLYVAVLAIGTLRLLAQTSAPVADVDSIAFTLDARARAQELFVARRGQVQSLREQT
jgi:hypothetical protein